MSISCQKLYRKRAERKFKQLLIKYFPIKNRNIKEVNNNMTVKHTEHFTHT